MESSVSREFWGSLRTCRLGMLRRILHKDASFRRYAPLRVSSRSWTSGPAAANASAAESVRPRPQNVSSSLSSLCNNRAKQITMHRGWNAHAATEALESQDHTNGSLQTIATQRLGSRMRACTHRMHDLVRQAPNQGLRYLGKQASMQHSSLFQQASLVFRQDLFQSVVLQERS